MDTKNLLINQTAVITGSAGLLGFYHAQALLKHGCKVIITDKDTKSLNKIYKKLKIEFKNILKFKMDVTSEASIKKVIKNLKKNKNKVNILINNASHNPKFNNKKINEFENYKLNDWNKEIEVGLTGSFLCSKFFGDYMKKSSGKKIIINISSDLSVISPDQRLYKTSKNQKFYKPVSYSVVKTGLIGLTRYLATYFAKDNIRCNALSPGGVNDGKLNKFEKKLKKLIPLNRMAKPNEYEGAIVFLCSDASSYLNGQNVVIDGGRSIW